MRALRSMGLVALLFAAAPCVAGEDEFGPKEARALMPQAAAGRGQVLDVVMALGAKITPQDMEAPGSVPLTHLLLLAPTFHAPDAMRRDFHTLTPFYPTPVDLIPVFYGAPIEKPQARTHDFPSVLHDEYITDVTCARTGDTARGEVTFKAPGAYEGRALWSARREHGAWQIVEFVVPSWNVRVRRDAWTWKAERTDDPKASWFPALEWLVVGSADLPVAGAVADAPEGAEYVTISGDGTLRFGGAEGGLAELSRFLRGVAFGPRMREPDGSSKVDLVLRFDRTVPWTLVQWVMMSAATVRIYRLYLAVRPEAGGEDGVIDAFLPKDRGPTPTPTFVEPIPSVRANLFYGEGVPDLGAVYAAIRKGIEAGVKTVEIGTPMPKIPAAGHVVSVFDLALRAGAERVTFEGAPAPSPRGRVDPGTADGPGSLPWIRAFVQRWREETPKGCIIKIGEDRFAGTDAAAPKTALPPPPPRRKRTPATATATATAGPAADEPLPEETEEVHTADMRRKEREVKGAELPGHTETDNDLPVEEKLGEGSLSDAPFEGPANNGLIGIGGGGGGAFKGRGGQRKGETPSDAAARPAIEAALAWLAAHQSADGGWEAQGFGAWCGGKQTAAAADGAGKPMYDVGVTGLALLAYLGAGYTNRSAGPFGRVIANGLRYLKNVQDAEGCFGARTTGHYIYNHAIATLAMVEAYGMTESVIYKSAAQHGLDFIAIARNPYFAWRYGVKPGDNDTSITGWMAMALKSAKLINLEAIKAGKPALLQLDEEAFDGVKAWLDKMTDPDYGRVGYQARGTGPARASELVDKFPGEKSESMTAIAVFLRIAMGENPKTSDPVRKGADLLRKLPPTWDPADGSIDFYYWHAGTLAMFQVGGDAWRTWQSALSSAVLAHQRTDGEACGLKGSWDPIDPWGSDGGRVYATALLACTLEASTRYPRTFARPDPATPDATTPGAPSK